MAKEGYDPEVDDKRASSSNPWSSSSLSGDSTSGTKSSYSQADSLDPVRRKERGDAQANSTKGEDGGATSSTGSSSSKTASSRYLRNKEEGGNDDDSWYSGDNSRTNSSSKGKSRFRITRRRAIIGGSLTALIIGGGVFGFSLFSGPLEFVHIAQLLEKFHFSNQEDAENNRLEKIVRYLHDPSTPERTRMGIVGNAVADKLEAKIHDATGLSSDYENGKFQGYIADPKHEAFKGKSLDEMKTAMADQLGVDVNSIDTVTNKNGIEVPRYNPDTGGFNVVKNYRNQTSTARALFTEAGFNDISAHMSARVLKTRAGWTFHPIKALDSAAQEQLFKGGQKALDKLKEQFNSQETAEIDSDATAPPNTTEDPNEQGNNGNPDTNRTGAASAGDSVQVDPSESNIKAKIAGGGAALVGVACVMNGINKSVPELRQAKVVLPMMKLAGQFIGLGSQVQSGQDIDATQAGFYKQFLDGTNSNGQVTSTWNQAQSIQAELGEPQTGPDLPKKAQVFNAGVPFGFLDEEPLSTAVGTTCGILGSPLGVVGSFLIAPFSSAFQQFAVGPVLNSLVSDFAGWLSGVPIDIFKGAGAVDGNYINYGARLSANEQYASAGGVQLSSSQELALKNTTDSLDNQQFQSRSFAYRIFNPDDDQTLTSQVIDRYGGQSATQDFASLVTGFGSIFTNALKDTASIFSATAHTSAAQPYDYHGLKAVGYSINDLDNPTYDDPFANACKVTGGQGCPNATGILGDPNSPNQTYITRAQICFGDTISPDGGNWDINFSSDQPIDMESDSYKSANCADSDPNWLSVRFWIMDTQTIEGYDCYAGGTDTSDQSCQDTGNNSNPSPAPSSTTASSPSSNSYFTVKGSRVYDPSGKEFIPYGISIVDDLGDSNWKNEEAATDAQIQAAAQYWHANTIRLQVSEDVITDNPAALQRLDDEIDEIEGLGKIPIINDCTLATSPKGYPVAKTSTFWNQVTSSLANRNNSGKYDNVIFDVFNEPWTTDWSTWQKGGGGALGMQDLVDNIRKGSSLSNNLIWVEGPSTATTLQQVDSYPISGANIVYAYHHLDLNNPGNTESTWKGKIGLNLKTAVPIVDGEWAMYAQNKSECQLAGAPSNAQPYLDFLQQNHIGLIAYSLQPGLLVSFDSGGPHLFSQTIQSWFPTNPTGYSQPTQFGKDYTCSDNYPPTGEGVGKTIMQYFANNNPGS